jgi:hypothetical protein
MSEWTGCFCLQCIREKEVGVVEDLGELPFAIDLPF